MKLLKSPASLAILLLALTAARADDEELVPLFNGRDLSGWVNVNCAPGTFTVRDGMIVSTGIPTGVLRTERHYENFVLELEWRHMQSQGNAGLFVWSDPVTARGQPFTRSVEVQILDGRNSETHTSHGDVFSIHGATLKPDRPHPRGAMRCLPSEWRAKPSPEWNHYRVTCNDGVLKLAVNGKVVSGASECRPRKGYICLEAEGSECHFRNIRIRELPSTNATAEETAEVDQGFKSLYTGVDLSGWRVPAEGGRTSAPAKSGDGPWEVADWRLVCKGKRESTAGHHLWSEKEYGDFILICDWRWADRRRSSENSAESGDSGIFLRGDGRFEIDIQRGPPGSGAAIRSFPEKKILPASQADEPAGRWNRFVITLKGDDITVELNGQKVVENARLSDPPRPELSERENAPMRIPRRGRIGIQEGTEEVEFANIYVRELDRLED